MKHFPHDPNTSNILTMASSPRDAVRIVEVGPRDGLQNIKTTIPTAIKLELIDRLYQTGLQTIEITSVVSAKAIPQLADCRHVLADTTIKARLRNTSLHLPVLIPNIRGLDIAIKDGVKEVAVFVSATEGFSRANINATVAEGLSKAKSVAEKARSAGLSVRGYISCIFADPYDGPTAPEAVVRVVHQLLDMGCYQVSLGDTLGVGTATEVRSLIGHLQSAGIPISKLAGHFHDTYGQAVSNVWQAYQCGIRVFDSSVGGLGGCPFAPGAKGNVATEDLVYLFDRAGVHTGVDLVKLVEVGVWISQQLRKENSSRAGAALAVKHRLMAAKQTKTATGASLQWTTLRKDGCLKVLRSGANVKVVLTRPKNGNALTTAMISQLTQIFVEAKDDRTISRIAIIGEGKFFCTGMDLGKGTSPVAQSKTESDAQYDRLTSLFDVIDKAPQVTIACINGPAFGGGVGLAFACDIRIGVTTASVTLSEVKLGLCPATISKYVIREWGLAFAREAMLSARPVSTAELKSLGLLSRVVMSNELLGEELDKYLSQLEVAGPEASRMCKELVRLAWTDPGGQRQESGIKELFDSMMRPDGEAASRLKAFQSRQKTASQGRVTRQPRGAKL